MIVKMILKSKARGAGVVTISPETTVGEAARILAQAKIGAVIAVNADGTVAGILSERDIVRGIGGDGEAAVKASVRSLMTTDVRTCTENDTADALMKIMTANRFRHLPVLDDMGRLTGMITIGDLVKSRLDEADMEVDNLRHYVAASR